MWIQYDEIQSRSIKDLPDYFRKKLSDRSVRSFFEIKISELIFDNDELVLNGVGVYLIFKGSNNSFDYVGKSSSRQFIERIPAHFDPRLQGWFNNYLKASIKQSKDLSDKEKQDLLIKKISDIFSKKGNYKLCLIRVPVECSEIIGGLETILRTVLKPLNKANSKIEEDKSLAEVLDCFYPTVADARQGKPNSVGKFQ
jgi:hypothetical protein